MSSNRSLFTTGVFYIAVARYSGVFFSLLMGAILARLLSPEEFGIVALVTVFVVFFNLLSGFGIGAAIVQNQTLSEKEVEFLFFFSLILGLGLSISFFLMAPLVAAFYKENALVDISRLLSLSILFNSWQIVPKSLLQKRLLFKKIGVSTVVIQLISGLAAIVLAYLGYSYFALVVQSIMNAFGTFCVFYSFTHIRIVIRIDILALKKIFKFSVFNFLFNFINYFSRNGDNLLIGRFLGAAELGFYDKAYRIMLLPIQNLTHVITPVLMPILSRHQEDFDLVYNSYSKVVKILATIGFPLSVFLFFPPMRLLLLFMVLNGNLVYLFLSLLL
jgi:PST family polysaccharide transporter